MADRLPTSVKELKETKGGLVASLYLAGRSRDFIGKELKLEFKVSEAQSLKITRRIVGRVRLYQRIFELVPVKKWAPEPPLHCLSAPTERHFCGAICGREFCKSLVS